MPQVKLTNVLKKVSGDGLALWRRCLEKAFEMTERSQHVRVHNEPF